MIFNMEVAVYISFESYKANKSVFQRQVLCPDAFNPSAFVSVMKSIFGEKAVITITVV